MSLVYSGELKGYSCNHKGFRKSEAKKKLKPLATWEKQIVTLWKEGCVKATIISIFADMYGSKTGYLPGRTVNSVVRKAKKRGMLVGDDARLRPILLRAPYKKGKQSSSVASILKRIDPYRNKFLGWTVEPL